MNRSILIVVIVLISSIAAFSATDQGAATSQESASIRGVVVDRDQKAVMNATILAWPMGEMGLDLDAVAANPKAFADRLVASTSSGADGRFEVVLPDRRYAYHVVALADEFAPVRLNRVSAGIEAIEFRLDRGNFVHGIVQDDEGRPIPDADVTYYGILADAKFLRSTKSSADGKFRIGLLPEAPKGRYFPHFLLARKDGGPAAYVGHERLGLRKGEISIFDHGSVAIIMSRSIEGTVTTTDGLPVADADVHVLRRSWCEDYTTDSPYAARATMSPYPSQRIATAKTNGAGRFRIDGLPVDVESLLVKEWWPRDGRPVPVLLVEKDGKSLGQKLFGLSPMKMPGVVDVVIGQDRWFETPPEKGELETAAFANRARSTVDVATSAPSMPSAENDPTKIGECSIVVVGPSGDRVSADVGLVFADTNGFLGPRRLDLNRHVIVGPPGRYDVDVMVPDEAPQRFSATVIAGQSTSATLKLRDASPLLGRVVGDGADLSRAVLLARDESGVVVEGECTDDGAFSFKGLPYGRWTIHASLVTDEAAFATAEPSVIDVGRASDVPVLTLAPAARVGVFLDLSGDDVESRRLAEERSDAEGGRRKKWGRSFRYLLRREGSDLVLPIEMLPEITSRTVNGEQEFGVLLPVPPGRWEVEVVRAGRKLFVGRCDVKAGDSTFLKARRL